MQLDIFEHSRDVMLRNSVIGTLRVRNAAATARAIDELAAEYAGDSMLPVFKLLCDRLSSRVTGPLNRASAGELLRAIEGTIAAAQRVFGNEAEDWLSPFWVELATATRGLAFDARDEAVHAAPFLLRAGKWAEASACIESIPSWRRKPAPLAWKMEATARMNGMDLLWPLLAELSWMAPRRAEALTERLKLVGIDSAGAILQCRFRRGGDGQRLRLVSGVGIDRASGVPRQVPGRASRREHTIGALRATRARAARVRAPRTSRRAHRGSQETSRHASHAVRALHAEQIRVASSGNSGQGVTMNGGSMNTGYALRRSSRIPSHCGKTHHAIYRRRSC